MASIFKYYNRNPNNKKIGDCVCKAISTATGLNYDAVNNLLEITSENYNCDKLCLCCYHHLLEDTLCYERVTCKKNETVEDIAKRYPRDTIIVRMYGHLTCIMKGVVLDIWDCSQEYADCYWFVT